MFGAGWRMWGAAAAAACVAIGIPSRGAPAKRSPTQRTHATPGGKPMSLEDARRSVAMLSDFYRESLLTLHVTYVTDGKPPSATVLKRLFASMSQVGWPQTRWLSVNHHPLNPDNVPRDAWEEDAARAIRRGETLVERVEPGRYRALAAVPFTGPCLKCHWGDKPDDYVGAIDYSIPLLKGSSLKAHPEAGAAARPE